MKRLVIRTTTARLTPLGRLIMARAEKKGFAVKLTTAKKGGK